MMDMNPTVLEAPYHDEIIIDGDAKALAPLLTLYGGMIACAKEDYQQEESMPNHSVERAHLILYVRNSCPYCTKVTKYLKKGRKTIAIKDIGRDRQSGQELVQIGGKRQVPCLVINGKAMYESSDILHWLKTHKSQY
ncbi:MAG: glutaredoxin [Candidatus Neptunochlamydia sp.]|nr:glutaredoxin [Candidatus Neptunochlamydia sp.]